MMFLLLSCGYLIPMKNIYTFSEKALDLICVLTENDDIAADFGQFNK